MVLPVAVTEALGHMARAVPCPEEIRRRIAALRVPVDEGAGAGGGRMTTNWRSGPPTHTQAPSAPGATGGGVRAWAGGGFQGPPRGGQGRDRGPRDHAPRAWGGPTHVSTAPRRPAGEAPRFGNRARKDVAVEERMLDRIRDKMNKFSPMTYDSIKGWLSQLLDSGETEFLTGFITLVFEKAAAEEPFCRLYAQLLTELIEGFPHLGVELRRIYDGFVPIFEEARDVPDVSSEEYAAYLDLRERRKYRRGYAIFVGEVAKRGGLPFDEVPRTCGRILDGLLAAKIQEGQNLLVEDYADCLVALVKSCQAELKPLASTLLPRVKASMDRTGSPSLTNKARFGLMDLPDLFSR